MDSIVEQALEDNIIFICINVDAYDDPIEKLQEYAISQHDHFLDRSYYLTTFRVNGFEKPGWEGKVLSYLKQSFYMAPIKFIRKMQEEFICETKNDL